MSLRVAPLTPEQAEFYLAHSQVGYVEDLVRAGAMDEDTARRKAAADYADLDVGGHTTYVAGHAEIDGREEWVGVIGWALKGFDGTDEPTLFVYDLEVFERFRRRGYGEALMAHAAAEAARVGARSVRLTVWEGNDGAKALYRKLGFVDENARMRMRLG